MSNINGIIIRKSDYPAKETRDRLQATLEQSGVIHQDHVVLLLSSVKYKE